MKIRALRDLSDIGVNIQQVVQYASPKSAGIDLVACDTVQVPLNGSAKVSSGIAVEFPPSNFGLLIPQTNLAEVFGLSILGGIVEEGYTEEIFVGFSNRGHRSVVLHAGDKIAQLIVLPYFRVSLQWNSP